VLVVRRQIRVSIVENTVDMLTNFFRRGSVVTMVVGDDLYGRQTTFQKNWMIITGRGIYLECL
jgi:hypothetical protein